MNYLGELIKFIKLCLFNLALVFNETHRKSMTY